MDRQRLIRLLLRSTTRNAVIQLGAVAICTAILFLFVALTFSEIELPEYTTQYAQKDTQQVVNLIIAVVATVIGILLTHCRRLTNEAETRKELRNDELTIPRLHIRFEAAGRAKADVGSAAVHNKDVRLLIAVYLFAMVISGFVYSVLSVIFVIEPIISQDGQQVPAYIPISVDIPEKYQGETVDECTINISAPGCAYDLAMTALTSQLVTYTPYTIAGVTFLPPNGTMGLPYYAMKHFSDQVAASNFEDEHRQYCLPVLDPQVISCVEEPFNQSAGTTISNLVQYKTLEVYEPTDSGPERINKIADGGIFKIITPYPSDEETDIKYRTNDESLGTFLTHMSLEGNANMSVITASDSGTNGYASMLHNLMYGEDPDYSDVAAGEDYHFVARCTLDFIQFQDNYHSSWRNVDFTLHNGVLSANVTDERCSNARGEDAGSGFRDLQFYLEGAGSVLSSSDGYSKLFNLNAHGGDGTHYFKDMSRLDAVVNQIYHIVQTHWMQMSHEYAMKNQTVFDQPIIMTKYPHLYVIRIHWTPATYIGLILAILITLNAYNLAGLWLRATYRFGFDAETWNLLRPVDLMAYSLAAYKDLIHDLNTVEHRRQALRGKTRTILHETPYQEGTQSLIGLVKSSTISTTQSPISDTSASSPISPFGDKIERPGEDHVEAPSTNQTQVESPENEGQKAEATTDARERDLERGE